MKKEFVKTKNVKKFIALMENLKKVPPNLPKMALVYGEHGLGKTQTIMWWVNKNDCLPLISSNETVSFSSILTGSSR